MQTGYQADLGDVMGGVRKGSRSSLLTAEPPASYLDPLPGFLNPGLGECVSVHVCVCHSASLAEC